jgi:prepilin-type N-terminal cleavage/methylation domain-containing protein
MRLQRSNVSLGIGLLVLVSRIPRKNAGFTLVELIVVITILAILGTIGFIQLGGFQSNTRDSIRTFDLTNLSKGLDVFQIKSGRYPVPTGTLSYTG